MFFFKFLFFDGLTTAKVSESGITVLLEADCPVQVPKGFVVNGNAYEVVDTGGDHFINENIKTPYVTQKTITVKCVEGTSSICVIYLQERFVNYFHEEITKKILK